MYFNWAVLLLGVLAIVAVPSECRESERLPPPCIKCNLAYRCNPYTNDPPIWTVVFGVCKLYKTPCIFGSENCHRQNDCLPTMEQTTMEECKQHCSQNCENEPSVPVCAIFPYVTPSGQHQNEMITHANQCALDRWACLNGQAYLSASEGACT